jgi:hypothetical protein
MKKQKNRNSFLLYLDSLAVIDELEDEQIANLFRAIVAWQRGEDYKLSKLERIAFLPIKNYMERDRKKYEEYIQQQREHGKKGGRPRKKKGKKGTLSPQRGAKGSKGSKGDSDSDSDSDSENDSGSESDTKKEKNIKKKKSLEEEIKNQLQDKKFLKKLKSDDEEEADVGIHKYKLEDDYINGMMADMIDYCKSKGETRKDYQATMRTWIRRDIKEHPEKFEMKFKFKMEEKRKKYEKGN